MTKLPPRDFEAEQQHARTVAARLTAWLDELHLPYEQPLDIEQSGMLADLRSGGIFIGSMITLEHVSKDELLAEMRYAHARQIAARALSLRPADYVTSFRVVKVVKSTASWMVEVTFDGHVGYARVAEYLQLASAPATCHRVYRLHQAKQNLLCDMPHCWKRWEQRLLTDENDYVVHLCTQHQHEDANRAFRLARQRLVLGE